MPMYLDVQYSTYHVVSLIVMLFALAMQNMLADVERRPLLLLRPSLALVAHTRLHNVLVDIPLLSGLVSTFGLLRTVSE